MKIVRAKFEGEIFYGELTDEGIIRYEGSPLVVWEPTEEKYSIDEIQLLAPVLPSKVTAVAKNYEKHAVELGVHDYTAPKNPVFFNKPSTSVIGTGESIIYPPIGQHVDQLVDPFKASIIAKAPNIVVVQKILFLSALCLIDAESRIDCDPSVVLITRSISLFNKLSTI